MRIHRRSLLAAAPALLAAPALRAQSVVTLNFWDMIWGPPEYIDVAKRLVEQFNSQNQRIQVRYRSVPWANWYQTFATAIGAGSAPDISTGAGYQAVQFYDQGAILPIDDVIAEMKSTRDFDDLMPGVVDRLTYDNHTVALPWAVDIRVWFYRRDLLEAAHIDPPSNWAELRSTAKALTAAGKYGMVASGDTGGSHYLYSLILNNGGALFDKNQHLTFENPRNVEALQFLSDVVHDGSMSPASAGYDSDSRRRAFIQGSASYILDGPGFGDTVPAETRPKIGLLPPPSASHGDKGTIAWVNNLMLYQQTKYPAETKEFLKWWSKNSLSLFTQGHSRNISTRNSFLTDPYFRDDPIRSAVISSYIPVGKGTGYATPGIFPQLNAIEGDGSVFTLVQQILQGKDVSGAMAQARPKLERLMG